MEPKAFCYILRCPYQGTGYTPDLLSNFKMFGKQISKTYKIKFKRNKFLSDDGTFKSISYVSPELVIKLIAIDYKSSYQIRVKANLFFENLIKTQSLIEKYFDVYTLSELIKQTETHFFDNINYLSILGDGAVQGDLVDLKVKDLLVKGLALQDKALRIQTIWIISHNIYYYHLLLPILNNMLTNDPDEDVRDNVEALITTMSDVNT